MFTRDTAWGWAVRWRKPCVPPSALPWPVALAPGWVLASGGRLCGTPGAEHLCVRPGPETPVLCRPFPSPGLIVFSKSVCPNPAHINHMKNAQTWENGKDVGHIRAQLLWERAWQAAQQTVRFWASKDGS